MSAPTPAPGDDRPREGYYPDPSIPGYVRYWNGAAWVPGTSRPAPSDGAPPAPPGAGAAGAGTAAAVPPVEETGPHFFDEDPQPEAAPADARHGSRPEPASAWGADRDRQSGFGGDQDRRVSWGAPAGADPRVPSETAGTDGTATIPPAEGASDVPSGNTFVFRRPTTGAPGASGGPAFGSRGPSGPGAAGGAAGEASGGPVPGGAAGGTSASGGPASGSPAGSGPAAGRPAGAATPGVPGPGGPVGDEGTMTFRAVSPRTTQQGGAQAGSTGGASAGGFGAPPSAATPPSTTGGPAFTGPGTPASGASASGTPVSGGPGSGTPASNAPGFGSSGSSSPGPGTPGSATSASHAPGFGAGKAAAERAAAAQVQAGAAAQAAAAPSALSGPQQANPAAAPAAPAAPSVPQQPTPASATPMTSGPGGGQPSWAQQVHRLAGASGEDQPVAPWKPPVDDIFQAAARRQAAARPASLGKRLAARLLDTVVVLGVTAGAAVPLGTKALDHVDEKIDAAKLSGETVTVWLLDGTTSMYLGIVLAVLLVFGALYEALPTAKWGRTLGKKLLGLEVRDIEGGEPPSFGAALRRWLVYSVPGLLVIGVVGVVWGLFDKPWRQCWHDKAAHTFVAG
ncbi:RDD family protein [Streptomyces sp. Act143]|uniref:RDD family protein n=1 Tax=Streptomyces sp. Act143 TaxID=2200760 RepID=UPI0015E81A4A|nr:RDD family protein [Streptomyces sp. Act143]